jgi:hypothetical protein
MSALTHKQAQTLLRRVLATSAPSPTLNGGDISKDTIDGGEWEFGAGNLPLTIGFGVGVCVLIIFVGWLSRFIYKQYHDEE